MHIETGMDKNNEPPTWEKRVGSAGFVLLCSAFVFLLWAAITEKSGPPEITLSVAEIVKSGSGYLVKVEAHNAGFESVTSLQIEGTLQQSKEDAPEVSTVQVDYLPSQSLRNIGLFFTSDPHSGELELRALGYQEP